MSQSFTCNSTQSCFENSGILQICYESVTFSTATNFCDCDNLLGFVGEDCNKSSSQTDFIILMSILILFVLFGLLVWTLSNILILIRSWKKLQDLYRVATVKVAHYNVEYVLAFLLLAILSLVIERCVLLITMFANNELVSGSINFMIGNDIESINLQGKQLRNSLHCIAFFSTVVSTSIVVTYLREVAILSSFKHINWEGMYLAFTIVAFVGVGVTIIDTLNYIALSSLLKGFISIILGFTILWIKTEVSIVISDIIKNSKAASSSFYYLIKRVCLICCISLLINGIALLSYSFGIKSSYKSVTPGEIHYNTVFEVIGLFSLLLCIGGVIYFSSKFLNNPGLIMEGLETVIEMDVRQSISYYEPFRQSLTSPHIDGSVVKIDKSVKKRTLRYNEPSQTLSSGSRLSLTSPTTETRVDSGKIVQMI